MLALDDVGGAAASGRKVVDQDDLAGLGHARIDGVEDRLEVAPDEAAASADDDRLPSKVVGDVAECVDDECDVFIQVELWCDAVGHCPLGP